MVRRSSQHPLPPIAFHLPEGREREALFLIGHGDQAAVERVNVLHFGHVAALHSIANEWSVLLNVTTGVLLKRWANALFPVHNQPGGRPAKIAEKFARVGGRFVDYRTKAFRADHPDIKK